MQYNGYTLTDLLDTINACTGLNWSQEDLRGCGERITHLQKLLNIRYGWKKEDDFNYPKRFMEPVDEGPAAGKIPIGLDHAIMEYYRERGWDEQGIPTPEKLKSAGLSGFLDEV
jgi:aldehyde:ferredoxin oxidoreductase